MADTLVGGIVHIDEELLPVLVQRARIDGVAVVLRGDEALLRAHHAHRLVVAAVAVLQLIDRGASSLGEQLVAHADTTDGLAAAAHLLADDLHGLGAHVGIARTIGQEETVKLQRVEIIIPRYTDDFHVATKEATQDVVLYTTVYEDHLLISLAFVVADYFLARNLSYEVYTLIASRRGLVLRLVVKHNFTHHHTVLTQHFGQFARVDSCDARHLFALQPVTQAFSRIPVAVLFAIVSDNQRRGINAVAFEEVGQPVCILRAGGYTVVTY